MDVIEFSYFFAAATLPTSAYMKSAAVDVVCSTSVRGGGQKGGMVGASGSAEIASFSCEAFFLTFCGVSFSSILYNGSYKNEFKLS